MTSDHIDEVLLSLVRFAKAREDAKSLFHELRRGLDCREKYQGFCLTQIFSSDPS
jgi:hypothetical protein